MIDWIDIVMWEFLLFSGAGLLIGGLDDLAIDLIWIVRQSGRRIFVFTRYSRANLASLPPPIQPGRIAVLIGAWQEAEVIGPMLRTALARIDHPDYRIYVGTYVNDPETVAAVGAVARGDRRVRLVGGHVAGPTTKGECLNRVWSALVQDEMAEGERFKAIVIHDAEDVMHSGELKLFDRMIERFDIVQLPVLPLPNPHSHWVAGHYCDEFAEAHKRQLVVREALGAGVPLAGVGCAISRAAMERMALIGSGRPFDETSLTEDYEIGLRLADHGHRGAFVSLPVDQGGRPVAVRAHFPDRLEAAVRQKSRWMIGIALSGWDRLGWRGHAGEIWMRVRDRRAMLAALVLGVAYSALLLWGLSTLLHFIAGTERQTTSPALAALLSANAALLAWRSVMRFLAVRQFYGWRQGMLAVLRIIPGNIIAMMAARRALVEYWRHLRGGTLRWDKTRHEFPSILPVE